MHTLRVSTTKQLEILNAALELNQLMRTHITRCGECNDDAICDKGQTIWNERERHSHQLAVIGLGQ